MDNRTKVKTAAYQIAFLMPHQEVNSDLIDIAGAVCPNDIDIEKINRDSPEYLVGAMEALSMFVQMLKGKGPPIK